MSYRNFIYLVTILLIGAAGYYFNSAGVPDLIVNGATNDDNRGSGVGAVEVFSGIYECNEEHGCKTLTRMKLAQDTSLDIVSVVGDQEVSLAQGTWGVGKGGAIVMLFSFHVPDGPPSLIANKTSSVKIGGFSKSKGLFEGMDNPTFVRTGDEVTSEVAN
jgi:hypothetical protein